MKILLVLVSVSVLLTLKSCDKKQNDNRLDPTELKGDLTANGALQVQVDSNASIPQRITLDTGDLSGSEIFFQPGSLPFNIDVSIETGEQLAAAENLAKLTGENANASVGSAGKSLLLTSNPVTDLKSPMTVKIDVPDRPTSLTSDAFLVIIYKIYMSEEKKWFFGIQSEEEFEVSKNKAVLESKHFGVFQPVWVLGKTLESQKIEDNEAPKSQSSQDDLTLAKVNSDDIDFASITLGNEIDQSITLTNGGERFATSFNANIDSPQFSFKGGSFPGTGGTCTSILDPGKSCTLVLLFKPIQTGVHKSKMKVSYFDGKETIDSTTPIEGSALSVAIIAFSDANPYDLGSFVSGSVSDFSIVINHSGESEADRFSVSDLTAPFSFKGGTYPGTGGTCETVLSSGSCTLEISFSPTAADTYSQDIELSYFDGLESKILTLTLDAVSLSPAVISLSETSPYDFGTIANNGQKSVTITVTNSGQVSATSLAESGLAAPFDYLGGSYPGTGGTCSSPLAAAGTCDIVVAFEPTSVNTYSETLTLSYDDGLNPQSIDLVFDGIAAAPATLTISDSPSFDYGTVTNGSEVSHTFTITNSGGVEATSLSGSGLAAPFSFKGGTFPGTGGTCNTGSIGAGLDCTVIVDFAPTTSGLQSDSLDINFNNGLIGATSSGSIQGTGVNPAVLSLSGSDPIDFGSVTVSTTSTSQTITVNNIGDSPATLVNATVVSPFQYKDLVGYPGNGGTCGTTIASAANCTIVLEFAPTVDVISNEDLTVSYNDGAAGESATRALTGTGLP